MKERTKQLIIGFLISVAAGLATNWIQNQIEAHSLSSAEDRYQNIPGANQSDAHPIPPLKE